MKRAKRSEAVSLELAILEEKATLLHCDFVLQLCLLSCCRFLHYLLRNVVFFPLLSSCCLLLVMTVNVSATFHGRVASSYIPSFSAGKFKEDDASVT